MNEIYTSKFCFNKIIYDKKNSFTFFFFSGTRYSFFPNLYIFMIFQF